MIKLLTTFIVFVIVSAAAYPQWVPTNGPFEGDVTSFLIDTHYIFAGTQNGKGVYRSTDNGLSWTEKNYKLESTEVTGLAKTYSNLYAATQGGIFQSYNNGDNWTKLNIPNNNGIINTIIARKQNVFAGGYNGIFRSTDDGSSWTAVNSGLKDLSIFSLGVNNSNVFAGTADGVYVSVDNGTTWTFAGLAHTKITALAASETCLFAGTANGIYISQDNGTNWTIANLPVSQVNSLSISGTAIYAGCNNGLYSSANNGISWTQLGESFIAPTKITTLAVSGINIFAGTVNGFNRSTDGGASWQLIHLSKVSSVRFLTTIANSMFAATGSGIFKSTDGGGNWRPLDIGTAGRQVNTIAEIDGYLFAGATQAGVLFRSTDKGESWTNIGNNIYGNDVSTIVKCGSSIFAGCYGYGISRSTDYGNSWVKVNNGINNAYITALAVLGTDIFAGTLGGGVYRSTNNGLNWIQVNNGLNSLDIRSLAVSGSNIFAGTNGGGVLYSSDKGMNWTRVVNGLPSSSYTSINELYVSGTNIFAGIDGTKIGESGIYLSTNYGTKWSKVSDTLTNANIHAITEYSNRLYVGGSGLKGVLSRPLSEMLTNNGTLLLSGLNGGEVLVSGRKQSITWVSSGISNVRIEYSTNDGAVWNEIVSSTPAILQSYIWDIPYTFSNKCRIRLKDAANPLLSDESDNALTIKGLKIIYPFGGESWMSGTNQNISWKSFEVLNVKIEYSADNGINWTTMLPSISASAGNINLVVPNAPSRSCRIRISDAANSDIADLSDSVFTITGIKVISPNGGEKWIIGSGQNIQWNSIGVLNIRIEYSTNNGAGWTEIISTIPADSQKYLWKIPDLFSDQCLIRISDVSSPGFNDVSDNGFTISVASPGTPILSFPVNNSINQTVPVVFNWKDASAAENYRLQVSKDQGFTSLLLDDSLITQTSKQVANLNHNTKYYWRVRAKNSGGFSLWSEPWSFMTIAAIPGVPPLIAPTDKAINQPITLLLSWTGVSQAEAYLVQLSKSQDFAEMALNDSTTSTSFQLKNILEGTRYYWRVCSKNIAGNSSFSEVRSFTTMLTSPENLTAKTLADKAVKLAWTDKSSSEDGFYIERKLLSGASFSLVDSVKSNVTTYTDSTLSSGTSYLYRVRAYNQFARSSYSNEVQATTTTSAGGRGISMPAEYSLYPNFPNPFNPTTRIKYALPKESHVRISIYNTVGEAVCCIVNEVQSAGIREVEFNAGGLPSGIYFCLMQANSLEGSSLIRSVIKTMLMK